MSNYLIDSCSSEYHHLDNVLSSIRSFVVEHPKPTILEFDYFCSHNLTLFYMEPNFDFQKIKDVIDEINKVMPSIKRIFSKPIIILRDVDDILPVEVVNKISQSTMTYLGNHFNDVSNIASKRVKPRKLLTQLYEDDYSIYENIIFCHFIDDILKFARKNMRILENMLYATETINLNFLERINHADYFLALGKLHTGYMRDSVKYYGISKQLYKELSQIVDTIKPYLKKPVYVKNKKHKSKLRLKKTNIFIGQKDYRHVYVTYKSFISKKIIEENSNEKVNLINLQNDYFSFVELLLAFSISNFSFKTSTRKRIVFSKLNNDFEYLGWLIHIENYKSKYLLIKIKKDKEYIIKLIPNIFNSVDNLSSSINTLKPNEVVECSPFEEDYLSRDDILISMENIESFRRIQQLLLKGMIYSDTERDVCPFCGGSLNFDEHHGGYICDTCHMLIKETVCPSNNKRYFYTTFSIDFINQLLTNKSLYSAYSKDRIIEGLFHYRNITKINENGDIVCPYCHSVHRL